MHYGTPRLFAPPDADSALLLGDYLYAHGLVRIAEAGGVEAVADLAELISLCAAAARGGRRWRRATALGSTRRALRSAASRRADAAALRRRASAAGHADASRRRARDLRAAQDGKHDHSRDADRRAVFLAVIALGELSHGSVTARDRSTRG